HRRLSSRRDWWPNSPELCRARRTNARQRPRAARQVDVLMNEQATRAGILDALRSLKTRVTDIDTVMLFFSGHGSTGPGQDGRPHYFLVPHDGRLDALAATALSDTDLEEEIGQIGTRRIVVMLDACFSEAGGGMIRTRGVTNPATTQQPAVRSLVEASSGRVV